jgi:hypothetical protein
LRKNAENSEEATSVPFVVSEFSLTSAAFQLLFVDHVTVSETVLRNALGTVDVVVGYNASQLEMVYRSDLFSEERAVEFLFQLEYLTVQALNNPQELIGRYR